MTRWIMVILLVVIGCSDQPTAPLVQQINTDKATISLGNVTGDSPLMVSAIDAYPSLRIGDGPLSTYLEPNWCVTLNSACAGSVIGISAAGYGRMVLRDGNGIVVKVDAENGGSVKIGGKQIIGPRLAAISDATIPEDMVVKFNLLLSAMRQHGLIEPGPGTGPLASF